MKAVLVTGASGGIGRAICRTLQQEGYHVIGLDQRQPSEGAESDWITFDLARLVNDAGIEAFTAQLERLLCGHTLTGLVNNAAIQSLGDLEHLQLSDFMTTMAVNVAAPLALAQICYPRLRVVQGSIVNIGSIHARLTKPGFVSYATSKAALEGLTRALAVDCGAHVRVNAVSPAAVDTEMLREGFVGFPEKMAALRAFHPVNNIATPDEIAIAVSLLLSGKVPFANGAIWNLDGGIGARLFDPV